ncbi:MAG: iron-containing redox enzyme family protein [Streptosporangiaceae bacterium]
MAPLLGSTSSSSVLRRKIALALPSLVAAQRRLDQHPDPAAAWTAFLGTLYGSVRASVPLLETALDRARDLSLADPLASGLVDYLYKHAEEERGHDEWLLQDLESVGVASTDLLCRPPSGAVAALIGAQYYWVLHYHPVCILGYLVVIEGNPPSGRRLQDLQARSGLPASAFRTMLEHADLDVDHAAELADLLDRLPLSTSHNEALGLSAISTVAGLTRVLNEVSDRLAGWARAPDRSASAP